MWKHAQTVGERSLKELGCYWSVLWPGFPQLGTYGFGRKTWFRGTSQLWSECEWATGLLSMQWRSPGLVLHDFLSCYHSKDPDPWKYPFCSQWSRVILVELTVTPVFHGETKMYLENGLYCGRKPRGDSLKACRIKGKRGIVPASVFCEGLYFLYF